MLSHFAIVGISGYQRYLSPRKGFACAYRVRHGGPGCSGFAKAAIQQHGLRAAIPLVRQRFAACRDAAEELQGQPGKRDNREKESWCETISDFQCSDCSLPFRACSFVRGKGSNDCGPGCCGD